MFFVLHTLKIFVICITSN